MSKDLIRSCLLYDFKVGLSAAASSLHICQAFGDGAVNECTGKMLVSKIQVGRFVSP